MVVTISYPEVTPFYPAALTTTHILFDAQKTHPDVTLPSLLPLLQEALKATKAFENLEGQPGTKDYHYTQVIKLHFFNCLIKITL